MAENLRASRRSSMRRRVSIEKEDKRRMLRPRHEQSSLTRASAHAAEVERVAQEQGLVAGQLVAGCGGAVARGDCLRAGQFVGSLPPGMRGFTILINFSGFAAPRRIDAQSRAGRDGAEVLVRTVVLHGWARSDQPPFAGRRQYPSPAVDALKGAGDDSLSSTTGLATGALVFERRPARQCGRLLRLGRGGFLLLTWCLLFLSIAARRDLAGRNPGADEPTRHMTLKRGLSLGRDGCIRSCSCSCYPVPGYRAGSASTVRASRRSAPGQDCGAGCPDRACRSKAAG